MAATQASIYLGLMSGTSLDGVDIAAVDFSGNKPKTLAAETLCYDEKTAQLLQDAIQHTDKFDTSTLAELDNQLGLSYASLLHDFITQHRLAHADIAAIGSHGHTLFHQPTTAKQPGYSLQIGNPHHIAAQTGCKVVADFRRADIALGGQGAPLAPAFHGAYLGDTYENRIVLNIGGIANISLLEKTNVCGGFDTGPGNTLMNAYCMKYLSQPYDKDGELAASGEVNQPLCSALLADNYFSLSAPKSTGPEYFNLTWLETYLKKIQPLSHQDILASLCYVTAQSIADACLSAQANTARLLVCGGGVHNKTLMKTLQNCIDYPVQSTAEFGLNPDYVEALAFAWFAKQRLENIPANLPQVTGAQKTCLLGTIFEV